MSNISNRILRDSSKKIRTKKRFSILKPHYLLKTTLFFQYCESLNSFDFMKCTGNNKISKHIKNVGSWDHKSMWISL